MVRRSEPRSKSDDRQFPIRLKFITPSGGLSAGGWLIENWLRDELGDHDHAVHAAGAGFAVYFRKVTDAQRFVDAFPDLALADGVAEQYGIRRPRRPMHETWHAIGHGSSGR
jgi:hypothetical protein